MPPSSRRRSSCVTGRSRRPGRRSSPRDGLTDLLRRAAAFGAHAGAPSTFVRTAARHTDTLAAVTSALGLGSYADWDEPARLDFLVRELNGRRPLIPPDLETTPDVRDVLDTFRMIARTPAGSLGAYVITMTRCASDVLAVELLQKEARVAAPLRVVPLFETSRDLQNAGAVVDASARACPGTASERADGRK